MTSPARERATLQQGARQIGVELAADQIDALLGYLDILELWRTRMNLVSARDRDEVIHRHLIDSLAVAPHLNTALQEIGGDPSAVVDIGSGAGLPGIPLAVAIPTAQFVLLEPRAKRVSFLQSAVRSCFTWNIDIVRGDVAALAQARGRGFQAAVSRATFPPEELPREALALLVPDGHLFAHTAATFRPGDHESGYRTPPVVHSYRQPGGGRSSQVVHWQRRGEKTRLADSAVKSGD